MMNDIYDPLTEYTTVFRERFKNIAETTFTQLANEANVDVVANQETCKKIYELEAKASSNSSSITGIRTICVLLWVVAGLALGLLLTSWEYVEPKIRNICIILIVAITLLQIIAIYPKIKALKNILRELNNQIDKLKEEAWAQMTPLNNLYDWDILTRMMCKTVPKLEFDPYLTTQRIADLKKTYGWDESFNERRSVLYAHSGQINGNPFVICRTKKMEWGTKTYYGSKTIHWTTQERGSDGHYHTVHHSETLTASVTAPYPYYFKKTRLIYGNTAAPELTFHRKKNGLADEVGSISYKLKRRKLRKLSRDLENSNYAMMTNEEFEVLFNTSNRNDNHEHALLFTPLAQESMIKLLKDETNGYGDNFEFEKNKMINIIISDHMQELDLDLNPKQYHNFDFNQAKSNFIQLNAKLFRAIYFNMAPLLCVPMYQQIRPEQDIYGRNKKPRSSFWEHEAQANLWGDSHFEHPDCATECILKTEVNSTKGNEHSITVHAHGFRAVGRVTYESVYGGDGRYHNVAVHWNEYFPVTGTGELYIKEDHNSDKEFTNQNQRIEHINNFLFESDLTKYRRNIASRV